MQKAIVIAALTGLFIVQKIIEVQITPGSSGQESIITAQHEAAIGEVPGFDCCIMVRRDIPIERDAELETIVVGITETGIKETGLAPLVNRKAEIGCIQNGNALELQFGASRHTHALIMLQFELFR